MRIRYGARVFDKNNKPIGKVDHLMRNTLTGEISKFVVNREPPQKDLFLSPQDVMEATDSGVKLKINVTDTESH